MTTLQPVLSSNAIRVYAAILDLFRAYKPATHFAISQLTVLTSGEIEKAIEELEAVRATVFCPVPVMRLDQDHHCHWPGCQIKVAPAYWGCFRHWRMLPSDLQRRIWATFRPGQEQTKDPSEAYLKVAAEAQEWIKANYPDG